MMLAVAAELAGGGLVAAVSDRLGFRRTLLGALAVSAMTYALLGGIALAGAVASAVALTAAVMVWRARPAGLPAP